MFEFSQVFEIYNQFLSNFPEDVRGLVSLFLAALLVYGIFKIIKKEFIYIILLIILLPASVPILKDIWREILNILQFLISRR